jgi:serine/threonine protein kinase
MSYLSPREFYRKYKTSDCDERIFHGPDYIVKLENNFESFVKELNIYRRLQHPNLARLLAWTIDGEGYFERKYYYLAVERGQSIFEAKPDFWQTVTHVLSALKALYSVGIVHNDLKSRNMIVVNGIVKLIDFGSASVTELYENGLFVRFAVQTPAYRDLEVFYGDRALVKSELYNLGVSLAEIFGKVNILEDFPLTMLLKIPGFDERQMMLYQDLTRYPLIERLTLEEIAVKYDLKLLLPERINSHQPISASPRVAFNLLKRVDGPVSTYFSAMNTFNSLSLSPDDEENLKTAVLVFQLVGLVTDTNGIESFTMMTSDGYNNTYGKEEILDFLAKILIKLDGLVISDHPWLWAKNAQELPQIFLDVMRDDYNPRLIHRVEARSSKMISCKSFRRMVNEIPDIKNAVLVKVDHVSGVIEPISSTMSLHRPFKELYDSAVETIEVWLRGRRDYAKLVLAELLIPGDLWRSASLEEVEKAKLLLKKVMARDCDYEVALRILRTLEIVTANSLLNLPLLDS